MTNQQNSSGVQAARVYLRVSTDEQDLVRQESIVAGARAAGFYVAAVYREKASGARPDRPELLRMVADLQPGEVVIGEKIDRISRCGSPCRPHATMSARRVARSRHSRSTSVDAFALLTLTCKTSVSARRIASWMTSIWPVSAVRVAACAPCGRWLQPTGWGICERGSIAPRVAGRA